MKLFVQDDAPGDVYAHPSINHGEMARRLYCSGFFEAARHLLEAAAANRLSVDTCFYPAMFLFRHAIELALKEMYGSLWFLDRRSGEPPFLHSLMDLWVAVRPELQDFFEVYPDYETEEGCPPDEVTFDQFEEVLRELHNIDPNGQAFRYPTSRSGVPTLAAVPHVNLRHLLAVTNQIATAVERWQERVNDRYLAEKDLPLGPPQSLPEPSTES